MTPAIIPATLERLVLLLELVCKFAHKLEMLDWLISLFSVVFSISAKLCKSFLLPCLSFACQKDEPDTFCWECFEATMDTNGLPANVYRFDTCDLTFDEVEEMIGHKIGYISNHIDTIYKDCEVKR